MWRNIVVPDRPQKTIRLVCWITKAADTHSEYVILIAFPLQQWLRQRTSMLHLFVIGCVVSTHKVSFKCTENTENVLVFFMLLQEFLK